MAIRAADVALVDLTLDRVPRSTIADERAHIRDLVAAMIEVQDDRIALIAVDTWVVQEESEDASRKRPALWNRPPSLLFAHLAADLRRVPPLRRSTLACQTNVVMGLCVDRSEWELTQGLDGGADAADL